MFLGGASYTRPSCQYCSQSDTIIVVPEMDTSQCTTISIMGTHWGPAAGLKPSTVARGWARGGGKSILLQGLRLTSCSGINWFLAPGGFPHLFDSICKHVKQKHAIILYPALEPRLFSRLFWRENPKFALSIFFVSFFIYSEFLFLPFVGGRPSSW